MSKKKIILIIIAVLIGAYLCFWTAAQIYNHYNPPVAADGRQSAQEYMEKRKEYYRQKGE